MENIKNFEIKRDIRQSDQYAEYLIKTGWKVIKVRGRGKFYYNIFLKPMLFFCFCKIQHVRFEDIDFEILFRTLKENRVLMVKVEFGFGIINKDTLKHLGFFHDTNTMIASKTSYLKLEKSTLMMNAIHKTAKRWINYCMKRDSGVASNSFEDFYKVLRLSDREKGIWTMSYANYDILTKEFGDNAFSISFPGLCGCLILIHDGVAHYYLAGSTKDARQQHLPYLVMWNAINQSYAMGCEYFDFGGVFDERYPNPNWKGFSYFKRGFGGTEVEYPGCYSKWIMPWVF